MHLIDSLKARGFIHQITDEALLKAAMDQGPVTYYCGFDPTASSLHAGSLLQLMLLAHLARAGHKTIGIVGGGTGMIGDPAGRDSARELLSTEKIAENLKGLAFQIQKFCPEAQVIDNAEWLAPLNYIEFLRDIGQHFSINRMMTAESVKQRLDREQGLSFLEFNYTLLQAYDFLVLNRKYGCTLQVGGREQWFNILMGTELIRRIEGKDSFGLTTPLLTTASGTKMGKSVGGAVWLDPVKTSAFDYYQFWYNSDDLDIKRFLRLYTFLPLEEITELAAGDFRIAKHRLALETTRIVHGQDKALETQEAVYGMFGRPGEKKVVAVTEDTPSWATRFPVNLLDALVGSGLCKSKTEARQKIKEDAVKLGEERVAAQDDKLVLETPTLLWVGKKSLRNIISQ
jgi:tyrosyl-tRNA synthetase